MALRASDAPLVTTYLEMTDPVEFRPAYVDGLAGRTLMIVPLKRVEIAFYRFLYGSVGEAWRWRDRKLLSDEELRAALDAPGTRVHVLYVDGTPAGYVELVQSGEETEIAYFGLRPEYLGQGLGKHLLSYGIARAWDGGARRVWVHTCSLDGPHALPNYLKRGFRVYHVDVRQMPERYL